MFNLLLIILVLVIYLITHYKTNNKVFSDKIFLMLVFILFFFLVGFRSVYMGNDTITYINLFKKCSSVSFKILSEMRYEKGYLLFNYFLSSFVHNSRVFLIVFSFIFNYIVYRFIKKYSKDYLKSILLYICLLIIYLSMTMFRQYFAMLIVLISYKYAIEQRKIPFILLIILAISMHSSAIVGLLIYPICNIKFTKKRFIFILLVTMLVTFFLGGMLNKISLIFNYDILYEIRHESISVANLLYALVYFIFTIIAMYVKKYCKDCGDNIDKYIYLLLFTTVFNIMALRMNVLSRMADYFSIFSIVAIPNVLANIKNFNTRRISNVILFIFLFLYSSIIITFRPEWNSAYNYKTCFFDNSCFYK